MRNSIGQNEEYRTKRGIKEKIPAINDPRGRLVIMDKKGFCVSAICKQKDALLLTCEGGYIEVNYK